MRRGRRRGLRVGRTSKAQDGADADEDADEEGVEGDTRVRVRPVEQDLSRLLLRGRAEGPG